MVLPEMSIGPKPTNSSVTKCLLSTETCIDQVEMRKLGFPSEKEYYDISLVLSIHQKLYKYIFRCHCGIKEK